MACLFLKASLVDEKLSTIQILAVIISYLMFPLIIPQYAPI